VGITFTLGETKMKITKEYIEGLKKIVAEVNKEEGFDAVNYLIGYLQGLINLYEAENENK